MDQRRIEEAIAAIVREIGVDGAEADRRRAYLKLGDHDLALLKEFHEQQTGKPVLADAFYDHLLSFDETRALLPDAETFVRFKRALTEYFEGLTAGDYGDSYIQNRLRIGLTHQRVGLAPKWYFGTYMQYLTELLPKVWEASGENVEKFIGTYSALLKVVFFDMGLAIDAYRHADRHALRTAKDRLHSVLSSVPLGMILLSGDFQILSVNLTFREMLGNPDEDFRGKSVFEVFPTSDLAEWATQVLGGGVHQSRTIADVNNFKGERRLQMITMRGVRYTEGDRARLLLIVEDITERRKAEEALQKAYKELQDAQAHLLQSEKMASLGQMAAGVAHEINNPVGFVSSNLRTLEEYVTDLLRLVGGYELLLAALERGENDAIEGEKKKVRALSKQVNADFLLEDLSRLVGESLEGIQRVRQIVQDLKEFSHVDQEERMWMNLNRGIESTLNIVWNELKYKADVIKELGEIPEILCYPRQINQVFMNLLVNAAQAIDERGKIWIRSRVERDQIVVEIEDTGCGIAEKDVKRIFDPFFTTKPVGKGTGLGLSVSYGIVRKHNGKIEVESTVGEGTRFRVFLPIAEGVHESPPR